MQGDSHVDVCKLSTANCSAFALKSRTRVKIQCGNKNILQTENNGLRHVTLSNATKRNGKGESG